MTKLKILDRGYWVSKLFYFRSWLHWFVSSIRFQSITFFSAVNPALHLGGMLDDRKSDIYKLIPEKYLPITLSVNSANSNIEKGIEGKKMKFPLIVKPDIGYKGYLVRKVETLKELLTELKKYEGRDVIIQEFLNHSREFAVLYYHMPKSGQSGVSSFIEKKLPFITGDGKSTLKDLILTHTNPFLDEQYVINKMKSRLDDVISKGEQVIIDHVGNYSRGSKFYSFNDSIDEEIVNACKEFFSHLEGVNFGRIDLKADSIEDVKKGNFKVMEVNGAKSEPLHIYDSKISFFEIWKVISQHWTILNQIVKEQLSHSFELPSAKDGIQAAKSLKRQVS